MNRTITISKEFQCDMGHYVPTQSTVCGINKCRYFHGHTVSFEIIIEGCINNQDYMVIDYTDLSLIKKNYIDMIFDHKFVMSINDNKAFEMFMKSTIWNDDSPSTTIGYQHVLAEIHHNIGISRLYIPATTAEMISMFTVILVYDSLKSLAPTKLDKILSIGCKFRETPKSSSLFICKTNEIDDLAKKILINQ